MQESHQFRFVKSAQQLQGWYANPAGKELSKELEKKLAQLLPSFFGYYALQVGSICDDINLLSSSAIGQKIYMSASQEQGSVTASPLSLPFPQDALDLIVLPHTLDFSHDPHQVLREAHRVLISEGHIVLIAFNPLSIMGLCKLIRVNSKYIPWAGHFYSARRLKDWLALLDFTVLEIGHVGLRPPVQNLRIQQRLEFLNHAHRYGIGRLAAVQIFVAKKRVLTLTQSPQFWRPRRGIIPVNVAEPSARQAHQVGTHRYLH